MLPVRGANATSGEARVKKQTARMVATGLLMPSRSLASGALSFWITLASGEAKD